MKHTRFRIRNSAEREVSIELNRLTLGGILTVPEGAKGIVLFAHGSGSSRFSPRNRFVAQHLQSYCVGTLLFDLLTPEEEAIDNETLQLRFDIPLLSERLIGATRWIMRNPVTAGQSIGYFGASTGAAAALIAAARLGNTISAVVSRGGRPDLAGEALGRVHAPTLLIVGGDDEQVITLNRQAFAQLGCREKKLIIVPGATHLFEEPGALEDVAGIATDWFASRFEAAGQVGIRHASLAR